MKLFSMFASIADSFRNMRSGLGGSGDLSGGVVGCRERLSPQDISALLRTEPLARSACEIPAEDISRAWRVFPDGADAWTKEEERLQIKQVCEKAMFWAEAFGGAIIIPRYEVTAVSPADLSLPARPVRRNALLGFKVYMPHQLTPIAGQFGEMPDAVEIKTTEGKAIRIHWSWVIPVHGAFRSDVEANSRNTLASWLGESRIDMVYNHLSRAVSALQSSSHLLAKSNIDALKVVGLADAVAQCDNTADAMARIQQATARAAASMQGASIFQPMVLDKEEEIVRANIGGGAAASAAISEVLLSAYVAATRIQRTRLLGEQAKGLNNGGDADRLNFNDYVAGMRERRLTPVLNRIDTLMMANAALPNVMWEYGNLYQPTAKEIAEIGKINADQDALYMRAELPMVRTYVTQRLQANGTYPITDADVEDVRASEGAIP